MNEFIEIPANNNSASKRKPIYGVGINDAPYMIQIKIDGKRYDCHYYRIWSEMLRRCYNPKYHAWKPTYIECSVSDDWLIFSNFKKWMKLQDWKDKELDKDLLVAGNKTYSADTCVFIPRTINNLLNRSLSNKGLYPTGVSYHKAAKKFAAQCNIFGKSKHIGVYPTAEEAHKAYKKVKIEHLILIAKDQPEIIMDAIIRHADLIGADNYGS
jgi:hypothetical protein